MSEIEFVDGMFVKRQDNAPEFVICNLSFRPDEFSKWLLARGGDYVNVQVKLSKSGKMYAAVDNWKPTAAEIPKVEEEPAGKEDRYPDDFDFKAGFHDDDIPF